MWWAAGHDRKFLEHGTHYRNCLTDVSVPDISNCLYGSPPDQAFWYTYTKYSKLVPAVSGVYFLYNSSTTGMLPRRECYYVGSSKNLRERVATQPYAQVGHTCLNWLAINEYLFAECYYIGMLRPCMNFVNGRESWEKLQGLFALWKGPRQPLRLVRGKHG